MDIYELSHRLSQNEQNQDKKLDIIMFRFYTYNIVYYVTFGPICMAIMRTTSRANDNL